MAASLKAAPVAPVPPVETGRPPRRVWRRRVVGRATPLPAPAGPPVPSGPPRILSLVGYGLMVPGLLLLLLLGFLVFGSRAEANRDQGQLYDALAYQLDNALAPVSGSIPAGTPVAVLRIPAIGVQQVVVNGSGSDETTLGPGLDRATAFPGQRGFSLLVGRRASYGRPFRHLDRLHVGDSLTVVTGQGTLRYVVDLVRRSNDAPAKIPVVDSRLTLVTSDPALTPDRQLLVSAALQGKVQPGSIARASVATDAPGVATHDHAIQLLLWSQLLLVAAGLATWAGVRHPKRVVWVGAAPVLLAILWNVFENLAVLFPNTL